MLALVLAAAIFAASGAAQVSVPRAHFPPTGSADAKVIIIGFVGGFVSQDDAKHPEVQFAAYVRVFNKPHHEIENDFRVWDRAAS
jgi:hypothetical protein